jgi:hypothetical protein
MTQGLSLGAILAAILSIIVNKSIAWAVFHGLCGWFYLFYYLLVYVMGVTQPLRFSHIISIFS